MTDQTTQPRIGRRAEKLDAINGRLVDRLIQELEPYSLDESIPNLEQGPKDELQVAHAQVLDYLREHMTNMFDHVKSERNAVEKLNELEQMILDAGINSGQRILPDPLSVVRALRIKIKMRELERLVTEEAKLQDENCQYMDGVAQKVVKLEERKQELIKESKRHEQASPWMIDIFLVTELHVIDCKHSCRYTD
ncbi:hypothetical protein LRAMOSA04027 [Lichtheimia ramosa]|uniref:Uncharacterized protein n=1 Tax=Lichtheimia ramosa TaxID=688394 RepID=A0A077WX22_9FUNG|nr:hypothetical protein LRAMOSA04027 [Lichtheimia ramosa]